MGEVLWLGRLEGLEQILVLHHHCLWVCTLRTGIGSADLELVLDS